MSSCQLGWAAAVPRNDPPPLAIRSTPDGLWQVCAAVFKGPIGGKNGDYFHVLLDTYSRWPEVSVTKSTIFKKLYPALDRS